MVRPRSHSNPLLIPPRYHVCLTRQSVPPTTQLPLRNTRPHGGTLPSQTLLCPAERRPTDRTQAHGPLPTRRRSLVRRTRHLGGSYPYSHMSLGSPPLSPSYDSRVNSASFPASPLSFKRCSTISNSFFRSHPQTHARVVYRYSQSTSHVLCLPGVLIGRASLPESSIAPYLTTLQKRVSAEGVRIGSYPLLQRGVYVSLIGANRDRVHELAQEVEKELQGRIVSEEEAEAKRRSGGA